MPAAIVDSVPAAASPESRSNRRWHWVDARRPSRDLRRCCAVEQAIARDASLATPLTALPRPKARPMVPDGANPRRARAGTIWRYCNSWDIDAGSRLARSEGKRGALSPRSRHKDIWDCRPSTQTNGRRFESILVYHGVALNSIDG